MNIITRLVIASALPSVLSLSASALDVTCSSGSLGGLENVDRKETAITLKGEADEAALSYIGAELQSLVSLDMSECRLVGSIPAGTFAGSHLAEVVFPQSGDLTIEDFAFAGTRLQSVDIPANVSAIGTGAFAGCPLLETVIIRGASSAGFAFANCPELKKVTLAGVSEIAEGDYADCPALTAVEGSAACKSVGASAFRADVSLKNFDFGKELHFIGASAYAGSGITKVSLDTSTALVAVGEMAFSGCAELESLVFPDKALIGRGALIGCPALGYVSMGCANNVPDYFALGNSSLSSIDLPSETASIGRYALKDLSSLSSITLPPSIVSLGDHAMAGMTSLESITVEAAASVPSLGDDVFEEVDCRNVRVYVSDNLYDDYISAPVWQDFQIVGKAGVEQPGALSLQSVTCRFNGPVLEVESCIGDIAALELFDTAGRLLIKMKCAGRVAYADTSSTDTDIFIVRCTMASSAVAIFKLAR